MATRQHLESLNTFWTPFSIVNPMRHARRPLYTIVVVLSLVAAACGTSDADTNASGTTKASVTTMAPTTTTAAPTTTLPAEGPVEITTDIDFSEVPYSGTFEVAEGSAVLGCTGGSFVDQPVSDGVEKVFTCEGGLNTGTFTVHFLPPEGPWRIVAASDEFSLLRGEGDFIVVEDEAEPVGVETLTGEIRYITEAEAAAEPTTTTTEPITDFDVIEVNSLDLVYECTGSGSPVIVISHGLAGPGSEAYQQEWGGFRATIDALSQLTEVCIFGRPGVGGSEPRTETPQTTQIQVEDLVGFAEAVGIDEPMIVIGYSWGGLIGQLLADQSPEFVAGLLLLDSSHPRADERIGVKPPPPFPPENVDIPASVAEVSVVDDLGSLPLYVLTAAETPPEAPPEADQQVWIELQEELAELSTDSKHEIVADTHHQSIPSATAVIVAAVEDLLGRIADGMSS